MHSNYRTNKLLICTALYTIKNEKTKKKKMTRITNIMKNTD